MSAYTQQVCQITMSAEYDVLVAGGGPPGIGAAIAAARAGAEALSCVGSRRRLSDPLEGRELACIRELASLPC